MKKVLPNKIHFYLGQVFCCLADQGHLVRCGQNDLHFQCKTHKRNQSHGRWEYKAIHRNPSAIFQPCALHNLSTNDILGFVARFCSKSSN